jgi:hypothetical protein
VEERRTPNPSVAGSSPARPADERGKTQGEHGPRAEESRQTGPRSSLDPYAEQLEQVNRDLAERGVAYFTGLCPGPAPPATAHNPLEGECPECGPQTVECDHDCGAKVDPDSRAELAVALVHWRDHQLHGECSHGGM